MTNRNHELLKGLVAEFRSKKEALQAQTAKVEKECTAKELAFRACETARNELARAIHAKCRGKRMIFNGRVYTAQKMESGVIALEIENLDLEIVE